MTENSLSKDVIEFFMNIPVFNKINEQELKVIAKHMNVVELNAGEVLFRESDKGNYVCFIVNGELDVLKKSMMGGDVALATLNRGHSIGEMSIIDDYPRSATVKARNKAKLFILSKSAFELVLERHTKIGIKLLKGIARLLSYNLRDTSERLAYYTPPIS